jgi:glycosyltransferase involved in cell wall biosynthesis
MTKCVSVILPAFNRRKFLEPAIESVFAQTYRDWELIVADDGSTDDTADYLKGIVRPEVSVIWLPHSGNPSNVRNNGIAAATGRYLAFLDSDDLWASDKLERQMNALAEHPNCRWTYSLCNHIDENGSVIPRARLSAGNFASGWIFEPLLKLRFSIAMPALVVERSLLGEAGGFDEDQPYGEFHELCLRLALKSEVAVVRETLCSVRRHSEHYSADRVAARTSWMRLYQKMTAIAPDRKLRSFSARMRATTSLDVARLLRENGNHKAALQALKTAFGFSWPYTAWWLGAISEAMRVQIVAILARSKIRAVP